MRKRITFIRLSGALGMIAFLLMSFNSDKTADSLIGLLGKTLDAADVKEFCQSLGNFELESSMPKYPHYMYISGGVELVVQAATKKVHSIFLMGNGSKWYESYKGDLPYGLLWSDTRASVEKKIAKGTTKSSSYSRSVDVQYPELHLEIQYNTTDDTDMSAKMSTIQIRTFD